MVSGQKKIVFYILLSFCLLAEYSFADTETKEDQTPVMDDLFEGFVYYANPGRTGLKSVKIKLPENLDPHNRGVEIIKAVIAGPSRPGLEPTWPEGVILNSFFIAKDGKTYVDLEIPPEVKKRMMEKTDTDSELLAVYSLVNSLILNVPQIKQVKILLQGKDAKTLAGHIDLDFFYKTNMLIVK